MSVVIRKATERDVDDIARTEARYIDCPWTAEQVRSEINGDALFFVAECDGEFAGYISATLCLDECEMSNVAVEQKFRRRGIGRKLIATLIDGAKDRGAAKIFLLVRYDNIPAISLYESVGFVRMSVRTGYYSGKDAVSMSLALQ